MNKLQIIKQNIKENLLEYLFYFFIFLLPWQTRWIFKDYLINEIVFEYGRMGLYLYDIILIFLLVFFIIIIVKQRFKIINYKLQIINKFQILNIKHKRIIIAFLLFCFYVLISFFWSNDKLISLYWGIRIFMGWGLFYLVQKVNFSKIRLAVTVVLVGVIQGLLGIYQFLSQAVVGNKWFGIAGQNARDLGVSVVEFGLERWLRAYGSLPHPNIYGALLVFSFVGVVYLASKIENKYQKLFLLFSSIFIVLGIILSFSRAAWVAFVFVFIFGFMWSYKVVKDKWQRKFIKWLVVMLISVMVFASYMVLPIIKTRLNIGEPTRLEIMSTTERLSGYQQAGELLKNNWLVGTGIGNYTFGLQEKYPNLITWNIQAVHNIPVLILVESGVLGFLIVILLNGYIVKLLIGRKKWGFVFMFLCFNVLMFFDHFWWTTASGMYILWMIMGLGVKSIKY